MLAEPKDFCRLVLLRHPELAKEHQSRAVGAGAAALSRRGVAEFERWARLLGELGIAVVYAPDVPQARDPARALSEKLQCDLSIDARLADQDMGRWQGRAWDDVMKEDPDALRAFFAEFGEVTPPGGESLGQALERMLGWWHEVAPGAAGKTLAAVLPGALIGGFAAALFGMRLGRSVSLTLPHGGIGVLDVYANGTKLAAWNAGALGPAT